MNGDDRQRSQGDTVGRFWAGFGLGVLSTIVAGVVGGIAFYTVYTGPMPAISVQFPEHVVLGEEFSLILDARNPHSENVVLDNVDIPNRFFEVFEFVSISPPASQDSPVGGLGTQTWYYDRELSPGASYQIILSVRAFKPGIHAVEFDVCNSYEDCSTFVGVVEVE